MGPLVPGSEFAGFRIEAVIGRGGMGVVFIARQPELERTVALKVIAPERVEDAGAIDRFLREARAAAAVEHPSVVPIYAAGVHDGMAYLAMRFIDGQDLRTCVRLGGALVPERAAAITAQAGAALDAIHRAGYIHRDVKPANVLLDHAGEAYLTDFGLAKALGGGGPTRSGEWVGTLDYVAPEQIRGGRVDARADVYALGGVLHFMLTGHVPFERDNDEAKLWALLSAPPPRPSLLRPELPPELDAIVERALAKHPEDRQPSAGDLARATLAAVHGGPADPATERMVARGAAAPGGALREPGLVDDVPTLTREGRPPPHRAARRRRLGLLGAVGLVAVAALGGAYVLATRGGTGRHPPAARAARAGGTPAPTRPVPGNHVARLPRVAKIIRHIGHEPNGIVEAGGSLWVTSLTRKRLTLIDPHTGRERRRHPVIGLGAKAPTVGGGSVWVPMSTGNAVLRLDPRSGRVIQRVVTALPPFQVAMGRNDVWILTRAGSPNPDVVLHYDASATHLLSSTVITAGATAIAAHDGTAWAAGLRGSWIFRIAAEDGQPHFWRPLLEPATTLAYGAGFLWASLPAAGAVARIDPASHRVTVTTAVGSRPTGIVVAHGRVFVACTNDHTVVMLNPRTARRVGRPLHVAVNPYAETADRRHVWVTGVGANTVTRIDYR